MQNTISSPLHTPEIRIRNSRKLRCELLWLLFPTLLWIALVVFSLIWRDNTHLNNAREVPSQLMTMASTILWGAAMIFIWDMRISPLMAYRKFLKGLNRGLSRNVEGVVISFDETLSTRDRLSFYRLTINADGFTTGDGERIVYWDVQLPRPQLRPGDRVHVVTHGNDILSLDIL